MENGKGKWICVLWKWLIQFNRVIVYLYPLTTHTHAHIVHAIKPLSFANWQPFRLTCCCCFCRRTWRILNVGAWFKFCDLRVLPACCGAHCSCSPFRLQMASRFALSYASSTIRTIKAVKRRKKKKRKKRISFAHNLFGQAKENFVAVGDNILISCCTCVATGERQLESANYIDNFDNLFLCWL